MKDIHATITERFIQQLKAGTIPWQKPWIGAQNIVSQKPYRGINALLLGSSRFESPYWMTFKQAGDLGGKIKKGAKSAPVIYYNFVDKRDADGNVVYQINGLPARVPFLRWANVFNLDQTEGVEAPKEKQRTHDLNPCERAAEIVATADLCPIRHGGFRAAYSPRKDAIQMPALEAFHSPEEYFHTLFHEAIHATGHASRLNREGVTGSVSFGSQVYSKEELIAELGAAFLSNEAGILDNMLFENSAAYLASWINALEKDHRLIVSAASQAQQASDFILGIRQKESITQSEVSPEQAGEQLVARNAVSKLTHPTRQITL